MAELTKIQWTDHTFNPWRGCTKVSAGCANCYAEAGSKRNPGVLGVWGPGGSRVVAAESYWQEPFRWASKAREAGRPAKVFAASLADVFEDWQGPMLDTQGRELWTRVPMVWEPLPDEYHSRSSAGRRVIDGRWPVCMQDVRDRLWWTINNTAPWLTWQVVTKRPEHARRMAPPTWRDCWPENLWLLTSVENQDCADRRIPELLQVPAAVRGLSIEPLLGPVALRLEECWLPDDCYQLNERLHWVIIGGESGPHARPCHVGWVRDLVRQCQVAGVAVFVKQLGAQVRWAPVGGASGVWPDHVRFHYETRGEDSIHVIRLKDGKGGDPEEWPDDLRVREFPCSSAG